MAIVEIMPNKKAPMAPRTMKMVPRDVDARIVEELEWPDETGYVLSPFSESPPRIWYL